MSNEPLELPTTRIDEGPGVPELLLALFPHDEAGVNTTEQPLSRRHNHGLE